MAEEGLGSIASEDELVELLSGLVEGCAPHQGEGAARALSPAHPGDA